MNIRLENYRLTTSNPCSLLLFVFCQLQNINKNNSIMFVNKMLCVCFPIISDTNKDIKPHQEHVDGLIKLEYV